MNILHQTRNAMVELSEGRFWSILIWSFQCQELGKESHLIFVSNIRLICYQVDYLILSSWLDGTIWLLAADEASPECTSRGSVNFAPQLGSRKVENFNFSDSN